MRSTLALLVGSAIACAHCAGADSDFDDTTASDVKARSRNWTTHPAIVEIDQANEIYAVSDPHGEYDVLANLLARNHLIDAVDPDPTKIQWTGGAAILVVAGDLIDKGPESLQVIDLVRTLEASAPRRGGRVVTTMGNHEAEFLHDPNNKKATSTGTDATGIDSALRAAHIDPKSLAAGGDAAGRGAWMANLPFGVRIKKWFFAHGGNTQKLSVQDLERKLERSLDHHGFGDKDITGKTSILEAQGWYGNPDDHGAGRAEAAALGVDHIVFGHDPGAFGEHGRVRASANGILFKIDTAMGIHGASGVGRGFLLHVTTRGQDTAEVLDDTGAATPLL